MMVGTRHLVSNPNSTVGRDVAQPGSALAWGARGPEFKSRRPDQYLREPPKMAVSTSVSTLPKSGMLPGGRQAYSAGRIFA